MAVTNFEAIANRTVAANEYSNMLPQSLRKKFSEIKVTYNLKEEVVQKLKEYAKDVFIVDFSAEWCEDCVVIAAVLVLLAEKTGMRVRFFIGLKKDPLNPEEKWRIPPSPPEVKTLNVRKIPHIIVFSNEGRQLGAIVESLRSRNKLEEEILQIIQ